MQPGGVDGGSDGIQWQQNPLYSDSQAESANGIEGRVGLSKTAFDTQQQHFESLESNPKSFVAQEFKDSSKAVQDQAKSVIKALVSFFKGAMHAVGKFFGKIASGLTEKLQSKPAEPFQHSFSYTDSEARKSGAIPSKTQIGHLSIQKHVQSVFRLQNKLDLTVTGQDGKTKQLIWNKADHPEKAVSTKEEMVTQVFGGIREALGNPLEEQELEARKEVYTNFNVDEGQAEKLNPFVEGERVDSNGSKEDILVMKFVTKEMSGYALHPVNVQFREYCLEKGLDEFHYSPGMRDQVEKCHVDLQPGEPTFKVTSEIRVPIQTGEPGSKTVVAHVRVQIVADVNRETGDAEIQVNQSDLEFTPDASSRDQKRIRTALERLPTGAR